MREYFNAGMLLLDLKKCREITDDDVSGDDSGSSDVSGDSSDSGADNDSADDDSTPPTDVPLGFAGLIAAGAAVVFARKRK